MSVEQLCEPASKQLAALLFEKCALIEGLIQNGEYLTALHEASAFSAPVDHFFEHVTVMADDMDLKMNRLALLGQLNILFLKIANWSLL